MSCDKRIIYILLVFIFLLFIQCSSSDDDTPVPTTDLIIPDLTGIDVIEGMTLVGIVTDAKTGAPWE